VLSVFSTGLTQAALNVQIGSGAPLEFSAGGTASVPVFAYNSVPGSPFSLDGFDLAFDVGGDGVGIPGTPDFFVSFQGNFSGSVFGQNINSYVDAAPFVPNAYDLVAGNSGAAFLVPSISSPTKLLDLQFTISPLATPSDNSLVFVPNATTNGASLNAISGPGTSLVVLSVGTGPNLNQFTVTAVPEPSALALIGSVLGVMTILRKRHFALCRRKSDERLV